MQPLWRTARSLLNKLKIELPYRSSNPFWGTDLEKALIQKDTCIPVFTAALFTIARTQKQPKRPSAEEWIKTWYEHAHTQWNTTQL